MIRNMIRAAALDPEFYNRAESTTSMTWQALAVVVVANALAAVGSWIGFENTAGGDLWSGARRWMGLGDFPIPDGPTTAVVSPAAISKSTFFRISISVRLFRKLLYSPSIRISGVSLPWICGLAIANRIHRIELGSLTGWIQGRQKTDDDGGHGDHHDIQHLESNREGRNVINISG